jgi:cation:H+ antiporter
MMTDVLVLVTGVGFLVLGANGLVNGAGSLATRFGVPSIVVGLSIVAFGTSAPELFVNIASALKGAGDLVLGNVIGSNIFNVLVILAVCSVITPLHVTRATIWYEIPLAFLAAVLALVVSNDAFFSGITGGAGGHEFSVISRTDGILLLGFYVVFFVYTLHLSRTGNGAVQPVPHGLKTGIAVLCILAGIAGLALGGWMIVRAATNLAGRLGVEQRVIAVTIVSVGTSLPELATSVVAARKGDVEIAVGNVVGSNIFNIFLVLGLSSLILPVQPSPGANLDMGVSVLSSFAVFTFVFTGSGRRIERWEGVLMLTGYAAYISAVLVLR